jgi:mannonate dehydratase
MYLSFRWYGAADPVSLKFIRQIPEMRSVVTSLYDVPAGKLWPLERLAALKDEIETAVLSLDVIESLPVHENIKLGRANRDELIDIYCQNITRLGQFGVSVICYNFMPLFDWFRTDLAMILPDGSNVMAYDHNQIEHVPDPWAEDWPAYFPLDDDPETLKQAYMAMSEADLRANLAYFLRRVVPAAEAAGIKIAIHPDDPPWSIFNLPRIVKNREDLAFILDCVHSPANGLTFCTGSLGANPENDLPAMIREFGSRIYFAHCRNVNLPGDKQFHESAHPPAYGDVDLVAVMEALHDVGFTGPMRPDHGRMIWDETGIPGYGLYDRALGAVYLLGVWQGIGRMADQVN